MPVQSSSHDESMESFTLAGLPECPVLLHHKHPELMLNQQQQQRPAPPPPPITPPRPPALKRTSSQVTYSSEQVVHPVEESSTENVSMVALPAHRQIIHQATASSDDSTSE